MSFEVTGICDSSRQLKMVKIYGGPYNNLEVSMAQLPGLIEKLQEFVTPKQEVIGTPVEPAPKTWWPFGGKK